jgi:ribosomal protein S18 acetylase RimI-like enzyme
MTRDDAQQIAHLINTQNQLAVKYTANDILNDANSYIFLKSGPKVVACVNLVRIQWYQFEVSHLSVAPSERGKGLAQRLLLQCEEKAKARGGHVLQCTIRVNNIASEGLFSKNGFAKTLQFHNHRTNNLVNVWQKVIMRD